MDTYAYGYGLTGHYAKPGTHTSYCGRELMHEPNTGIRNRICTPCIKAEQRDRVEAEQVAADRAIGGPTLAERAGVRYTTVGTGRRVHYSPSNDETLCGREISEYVDGSDLLALLNKGHALCAPCDRAAEKRAYARALAAASPLAAAAVDLAETVEQVDAEREQALATVTLLPSPAHRAEVATLTGLANALAEAQQRAAADGDTHTVARLSVVPNEPAADLAATVRALDAVEYAEQVEAGVETVADAEALYAAALVTEAEATDGTWQGAWIGEQPAGETLFDVKPATEQGALFVPSSRVVCAASREPIVARATFRRDDLDRIKAKADADRAAYRAEIDDRIAAECAAHGVAPSQGVRDRIAARAAEQAPARRVIEGVIVSHNGTTQGSTPANATHPNVIAARAALDNLAVATMTDHHDVTEPTAAEQHVRGFMVDPREGARVAVYWLEGGRIIRRDDPWHGPSLDGLADRLARRGWTVEKMLKSSQCVFAHRPSTD